MKSTLLTPSPPSSSIPDLSTKDVAFVIASNFALCTGPDAVDVDWSKVPSYVTDKEHGVAPWFANQLFGPVFAQMAPPPADVHRYCIALLLPLLRGSTSLGSELVANKVENHFVKGELLDAALLPSVVAALTEAHKVTAVDVATVIVQHFLPLVHGAPCKLQVSTPTLCASYLNLCALSGPESSVQRDGVQRRPGTLRLLPRVRVSAHDVI